VQSERLWRGLLGLENAVVEGVEFWRGRGRARRVGEAVEGEAEQVRAVG
jgi:hypothetical protein